MALAAVLPISFHLKSKLLKVLLLLIILAMICAPV